MTATQIAARLSARVFLGERLCHNNDWIEISIRFTIVMMRAQDALRSWPLFMRPFVHFFIPEIIYLKRLIKDARKIIEPELEFRMAERPDVSKPQDSLSWLEDVRAGRPFDVVSGQLFLTVAAIHTTSVVITALMYDLVKNPEYIHLLREEAIKVYREDKEWNKTSLYKLKLLDSCMKESQRLNILGPSESISPPYLTISFYVCKSEINSHFVRHDEQTSRTCYHSIGRRFYSQRGTYHSAYISHAGP